MRPVASSWQAIPLTDRAALKASEYLNVLLARGLVVPQASKALDGIYAEAGQSAPYFTSSTSTSSSAPTKTSSPSSPPPPSPDGSVLLVTKPMIPRIIEALKLGEGAQAELNRAVDQAKARIKNMEQQGGGPGQQQQQQQQTQQNP